MFSCSIVLLVPIVCPSTCLSACLPACLPACPPVYLPTCLPACLSACLTKEWSLQAFSLRLESLSMRVHRLQGCPLLPSCCHGSPREPPSLNIPSPPINLSTSLLRGEYSVNTLHSPLLYHYHTTPQHHLLDLPMINTNCILPLTIPLLFFWYPEAFLMRSRRWELFVHHCHVHSTHATIRCPGIVWCGRVWYGRVG